MYMTSKRGRTAGPGKLFTQERRRPLLGDRGTAAAWSLEDRRFTHLMKMILTLETELLMMAEAFW